MRVLTQDFGEWRHEPLRAVTPAALKAAHTLAGTSATVGFKALREVAYALEMALLELVAPAPVLSESQRDLLDAALECARQMLQRFAQGELAPAEPELVARLVELREQLCVRGEPASQPAEAGARSDYAFRRRSEACRSGDRSGGPRVRSGFRRRLRRADAGAGRARTG